MLPPDQDQNDRRPIWDALQMFWMDTDPELFIQTAARTCAQSKYSLSEVKLIFWNEVRPAVDFNLHSIAGEWTGFDLDWLSERILKTHHFGRDLPNPNLHPGANSCWIKLRHEIERAGLTG